MRVKEVEEIMGKPTKIAYDTDSHTYEYLYFSGVIGKSTEPSVTFDTTNTVVAANYGD